MVSAHTSPSPTTCSYYVAGLSESARRHVGQLTDVNLQNHRWFKDGTAYSTLRPTSLGRCRT